jgi:hypothetical protein
MRTSITFLLLFSLSLGSLLTAQPGTPPPAVQEMAAVDHFLALDNTELDELLAAIIRIRAMSTAERAALREEIARYRTLPEPQRQQLRHGWGGGLSAAEQEDWRRMMHAATPQRRAEIQATMQALNPSERAEYRKKILAAPDVPGTKE